MSCFIGTATNNTQQDPHNGEKRTKSNFHPQFGMFNFIGRTLIAKVIAIYGGGFAGKPAEIKHKGY